MGRKKKEMSVLEPEIDIELLCQIDDIYLSLTEKYFELASIENSNPTRAITNKLDKLELAIKKRKEDIKNGNV